MTKFELFLSSHEISVNYIEALVEFLYSYKWIYQSSNTRFVKENVLTENEEFLNLFESVNLNELIHLKEPRSDHPDALKTLIRRVNSFKVDFETMTDDLQCLNLQNKISVKKTYEIQSMGKIINNSGSDVDVFVDLGSGLGYLDEHLFLNYGHKVIGLEGDERKHLQALSRQEKYCSQSIPNVKHMHHFITLESAPFIEKAANNLHNQPRIALIGLHPCGDVSCIAIKLFLSCESITDLIIAPCCYHKLSGNSDFTKFDFFPLSDALRTACSKYDEKNPFLRTFLRLSGQQSPLKFSEMSRERHFERGKAMFERAIAEVILENDEKVKKINKISNNSERIKFEDISMKYQAFDKITNQARTWTSLHEARFDEIRMRHPNGEEQSEIIECLQALIQHSCENLVIMDRIVYIREQAALKRLNIDISVKKLRNEKLTPRCHVIILRKT